MRLLRWSVASFLVVSLVAADLGAQMSLVACAPAPHAGETVKVSGETALIVWDPKAKREQFIRQANFETDAQDFGFLVPTPTTPELGEVARGIFDGLESLTQARHVFETKTETSFGFGDFPWPGRRFDFDKAPTVTAMAPSGAVEVIHEQKVAGLDAAILRADTPESLVAWLKDHGYETRPALVEWLAWYTEHHWVITAFKLSKDGSSAGGLRTKLVRMSFDTDRPFYPYREPADMRQSPDPAGRSLRVFFLADQKYEGTLGESGQWPATLEWANTTGSLPNNVGPDFAKVVGDAHYLTEFEDRSNPRPGTDEVFFRPATDTSTRERPPIVHTQVIHKVWPGPWGGLGIIAVGLIGVTAFVTSRIRRRPRKPEQGPLE